MLHHCCVSLCCLPLRRYVWDAKQHKFVPKDADADAAAGLPYNEEDMVFGGVDEVRTCEGLLLGF